MKTEIKIAYHEDHERDFDTTLFNYAGHTQQKLVSRWGVGKHVRISYVCIDVLKINIFIYILHRISAIK